MDQTNLVIAGINAMILTILLAVAATFGAVILQRLRDAEQQLLSAASKVSELRWSLPQVTISGEKDLELDLCSPEYLLKLMGALSDMFRNGKSIAYKEFFVDDIVMTMPKIRQILGRICISHPFANQEVGGELKVSAVDTIPRILEWLPCFERVVDSCKVLIAIIETDQQRLLKNYSDEMMRLAAQQIEIGQEAEWRASEIRIEASNEALKQSLTVAAALATFTQFMNLADSIRNEVTNQAATRDRLVRQLPPASGSCFGLVVQPSL